MLCKPIRTCHLGKLLGLRSIFCRRIPDVQNLSMALAHHFFSKLELGFIPALRSRCGTCTHAAYPKCVSCQEVLIIRLSEILAYTFDQSRRWRLLGIAIFLRYLVIVRRATPSPCFLSSSTKSSSLSGFCLSSFPMISCSLMRIVS